MRSGDGWTQQAQWNAPGWTSGDNFGWSVGIDGDTIVVGAPRQGSTLNSKGSAYVYTRSGGVWLFTAELSASEPLGSGANYFGYSVGVKGDTIVVGSPSSFAGSGGSDTGAAYVFARTGGVWSAQAKLWALDAAEYDIFGRSVAVDGGTIVVGADGCDSATTSNSGAAYVFLDHGASLWWQQAKLVAPEVSTNAGFGRAVGITGDTVVVGAPGVGPDLSRGSLPACAYVFARTGTTWNQQAQLTTPQAERAYGLGWSVAINDARTIALGAPDSCVLGRSVAGSVVIFSPWDDGWAEQEWMAENSPARGDEFGIAVALDGDSLAVGAQSVSSGTTFDGRAYVYDLNHLYVYDQAVVGITVPRKVVLSAAVPRVTKRVSVTIQNRGGLSEAIFDTATLGHLVTLTVSSLAGACSAPVPVLSSVVTAPVWLKPNRKLRVNYNVTFDCANDGLGGSGHEDFSYTATVNHAAINGAADTSPADDVCPRPPGLVAHDPGCGRKDTSTGHLGASVTTDVVVKP